jgi:hypothetical protein
MAIKKFYKIVTPRSRDAHILDGQDAVGSTGLFGRMSWYNRLVQGSASRKNRYREYDVMDNDPDIALALDLIAEEMTGNNPKGQDPLELHLKPHPTQRIPSSTAMTLKAALKTFISIHKLDTPRLFNICRNTIKYGDMFFLRSQKRNGRWLFVHPKNVEGGIVPHDDISDVKGWSIKTDFDHTKSNYGTNLYTNVAGNMGDANIQPYLSKDVIRFTLWDEASEEAPFGISILRAIYKPFKQKELLEDAIVIYRIQRAPERRVFYIDVGRIHPHQVSAVLEKVKNDFRQKRIPSQFGGNSQVDAIYNPQSMQEDFFMAVRPNSQGGRIETLPGGQNLGNLDDLHIFFRKIWRGLKIPESYINTIAGDGGLGTFNDVRVGVALMQEVKFTLYIQRLQTYIENVLDEEFKKFIYDNGINVDPTIFQIKLPPPSNFEKSRQQELDAALLSTYGNAKDDNRLSARFAMKKYLQLSHEEMMENERLLREEKGLPVDGGIEDLPKLYNPEEAEAGGFEGGLGGLGGEDMGTPEAGGPDDAETPGEEPGMEPGEEGPEETPGEAETPEEE